MVNPLRQAIERSRLWLQHCKEWLSELLGLDPADDEQDKEDSRRAEARARFWTDLREGERQAKEYQARQES